MILFPELFCYKPLEGIQNTIKDVTVTLSLSLNLIFEIQKQNYMHKKIGRLILMPVFNDGLYYLVTSSLHFLRLIPGRGRRSGSVVSKSFCRLHLLAPPAVPAFPGSQDRAISLWVCLLVAFRGSPCPSLV